MRLTAKYLVICGLLVLRSFIAFAQQDPFAQLDEQISQARNLGNMDVADSLATEMLALARAASNTEAQADARFQQGRNAMERNLYPQAQTFLNDSIALYQDVDSQLKLGKAYSELGMTYRYQANYPVALDYIYLGMQIFQRLGDEPSIRRAHSSVGVVLEKMGQYEDATLAHKQALEMNYASGDVNGIAGALYNLGDLRRLMGDFDTALAYFNDALELDLTTDNQKNIAYSYHKIGFIHKELGDFDTARQHIQKALEIFREIQTPRDTDWALTSMAELELLTGNLEKARSIIDGVIMRATQQAYKSLLVDAYKIAARVELALGNTEAALDYIQEGLTLARLNGEKGDEAVLQELLVKAHLAGESINDAFDALQRQKRLDDEILNKQRLDSIAKLQAQAEFVRREQQITLLEKEKALQSAELKQQSAYRNLWLITALASAILIFLMYTRFLQFRVNARLEKEVAQRTKELEDKNTQLAMAYEEMEAISLTDKLTGLRNRRFLENQIDADLQKSLRQYQDWQKGKHGKPVQADIVLFVIDMDDFKSVNDVHGHNAGDNVLKELATRMAKVFRHSDYLVRWGGEEFVALARFIDRNDAPHMAQRMLEAVNTHPFELVPGVVKHQTCSIGFACYPPIEDCEVTSCWISLVAVADACLYAAKSSGKNAWIGARAVKSDAGLGSDITPKRFNALVESGHIQLWRPDSQR